MTDEQEERHHTDAEYDELKAKYNRLEAASEQAIVNCVRFERAETEVADIKQIMQEVGAKEVK